MICRHCGKDNRLSPEEKRVRISNGLKSSLNKVGAKRRIDYNLVYSLRDSGKSLNEIAKIVSCTKAGVCRVLKKRVEIEID